MTAAKWISRGAVALLAFGTALWSGAASAQTAVTITQVSSGRCISAYQDAGHDYGVVTRPCQQYDTAQLWFMRNYGSYVTFEQVASGRFLDAHEIESLDYRLVTRPAQNNNTQHWILATPGTGPVPPRFPDLGPGIFQPAQRATPMQFTAAAGQTIQMQSNGRYVDAHEYAGMDFAVVTRPAQNNNTQLWRITVIDPGP